MTGFDLVTRLFGLLLGLAIAEVLTGFARTLRVKANLTSVSGKAIRVGWLVPLLGMLVIVDQTSFWLAFYELHGNVPLNFLVLLCVLLVIGAYYLLSTFVFPFEPALWPDYDAYYLRVHRVVIGGVLAVNLASIAFLDHALRRCRGHVPGHHRQRQRDLDGRGMGLPAGPDRPLRHAVKAGKPRPAHHRQRPPALRGPDPRPLAPATRANIQS